MFFIFLANAKVSGQPLFAGPSALFARA